MKIFSAFLMIFAALNVGVLANPLSDIDEVRFDGATGNLAVGGGVLFKNLRIKSAQTDFEDYIEATYSQGTTGDSLTLQNAMIYPDVGIFQSDGEFFVKNVPPQIFMYRTVAQPNQYVMDTQYTISAAAGPYYMDLTAGQSLSFHIAYPTDATTMVVTAPSGREIAQTPFSALSFNTNLVLTLAILETGTHRIDFVPDSGNDSSIRFRFLNNNRNEVRIGAHGKTESFLLRAYSNEYEKLKLSLEAHQTVTINFGTVSGPIQIGYSNSRGSTSGIGARGFSSGSMNFTSTVADDYYLFFYPSVPIRSTNTSVSFTVSIQSNLSFANWTAAYGVSALRRSPLADSDGDGTANIVEYALGTNPVSAASNFIPELSWSGDQARLTYTIPHYVEGVTIVPQESSSLNGWEIVTPVPAGSTPTGQQFEATTSGTSNAKFLRLMVE